MYNFYLFSKQISKDVKIKDFNNCRLPVLKALFKYIGQKIILINAK